MFAFTISLIGLPVIKNSDWRRIQNQIVHCEAEMFDSSRLIEIVALVQFNLALLNGNLICEYTLNQYYGYTCTLSVNQLTINGTNDAEILGEHLGKRNDSDVKCCDGKQASMEKFPPICRKFTSLVQISFYGSGLQFIEADSFDGCTHLATLYQTATI